jgi:hypothetical protein
MAESFKPGHLETEVLRRFAPQMMVDPDPLGSKQQSHHHEN